MTNGLAPLLPELLDDPTAVRAAIVLFDVNKITEDPGTGDRVPQVRIRSIEPVSGDGDAEEIQRMFRRAAERRTGQTELPLELEREIDAILDDEPGGDQTSPQDRPGWGVGPTEPDGPPEDPGVTE
jgi:hypothetical protein